MNNLASRVFLCFDDFSLASKYTLHALSISKSFASNKKQLLSQFPEEFKSFISILSYPDADLCFLFIDSAAIPEQKYYKFATTLVIYLSSHIELKAVTILASIHLPSVKFLPEANENVYYYSLTNITTSLNKLKQFNPSWLISEKFLCALLHIFKIELAGSSSLHSFAVDLLIAKGNRPGMNYDGTRDGILALATGLESKLDIVTVDSSLLTTKWADICMKNSKIRRKSQANSDSHELLYQ